MTRSEDAMGSDYIRAVHFEWGRREGLRMVRGERHTPVRREDKKRERCTSCNRRVDARLTGGVEGFLNAVSMVDVDVNVQNSFVILEELKNGKDNVVDIAEARGLIRGRGLETRACMGGDLSTQMERATGRGHQGGRASRYIRSEKSA